MKIRLADEDRRRHVGCPEWLDWDGSLLTQGEAEALQEYTGVVPEGYWDWLKAGSEQATRFVAWLCLRRAGINVDWATFKPDVDIRIQLDPEPDGSAQPVEPALSLRLRREQLTPDLMHYYGLRWHEIPDLPHGLFERLVARLPPRG